MAGAIPGGPFYRDETRPFAQRHQGMSLDVVQPGDVPQGKVQYPKDESLSLKTQDIYKAQPHYEHTKYLNKPELSVGNTNPTHPGGRARTYYAPMDRRPRDLSLTTADIEYAQCKPSSHKGNRHTDPVCPQYELPSYVAREPTPPRFNGRHTNDIADIEHSNPRVLHPDRNYVRDPNEARDIEYASANYRERNPRHPPRPRADRSLDVQDISGTKRMPARDTNPLEPVYKVPTHRVTTSLHTRFSEEQHHGVELPPREALEVGEVQGSKPRKLQWDNGEPQLSLQRQDLPGAVPQRYVGHVKHNIYDPPEVRPMVSFHDPHDIPGAQVGSLKRGLASRRSVNPLNPAYTMLDGDDRHPAPVIEAERGSAQHMHPMMRSHNGTSSMPNLHGGGATPSRSGGGSSQPSGRSMQRDMSAATLRRSPQDALEELVERSSPWHSGPPTGGTCTPADSQGRGSNHSQAMVGGTLRFDNGPSETGTQQGQMSRRSASSSGTRSSYGVWC